MPSRTSAPASVEDLQPVREELERVLASPEFVNAGRLSRFLRFIVQETIAGRAAALKESCIAVEVYDRPPEYDPKLDAIVRVEAGRLRSKLDRYYGNSGSGNPLRIALPKGAYVPDFTGATPALPPPPSRVARPKVYACGAAAVLLVACTVIFVWPQWKPAGITAVKIVVANESGVNPETALFTTQLTERLIQKLTSIDVFAVVPDKVSNARTDNLLRVSAALSGAHLQAGLSLVSTKAGNTLWGESYESPDLNPRDFVDRVSELAVRTLLARFPWAGRRHQPEVEALRLYSRGREEWSAQRLGPLLRSVDYYRQALQRDPLFAKAHAALAESELFIASIAPDGVKDRVDRAREAASRAIELDEYLPEAHAVLGNIFLWRDWNLAAAERELRRALELQPGISPYERWYALAAEMRGHAPAALEELDLGELTNPRSEVIKCEMAGALLQLNELVKAQSKLDVCLSISPWYGIGIDLQGRIQEARGDYRTAIATYSRVLNLDKDHQLWRMASLGHAEIMAGDGESARRILQQILTFDGQADARRRSIALLEVALGQTDEAVAQLEAANREHAEDLPLVALDRRFSPLQGNPRYQAVLRATGLPVAP